MAYTFSVNNLPATGAVAMYTLVATLIAAGWTQSDSSDGTTRSAGQVTHGGSGTNGLGNNSAWVRLKAPAVNGGALVNQQREVTIQRGTTDLVWRVKYSAGAGFTGGSPSATQTPSAADAVIMAGAGTDASPTYGSIFASANGAYRWHVMAGGASELYNFLAMAIPTGTVNPNLMMYMDVLLSGSYQPTDVDPAVMYMSVASTSALSEIQAVSATTVNTTVVNPSRARAWMGVTGSAEFAVTGSNSVNVWMYGVGSNIIGGAAATMFCLNPFTKLDDQFPAIYARTSTSSAPSGMKGVSTLFKWNSVVRANLDTWTVVTFRDRVAIYGMSLPWAGVSPAI